MDQHTSQLQAVLDELPGLDCGLCGFRSCDEFARILVDKPSEAKRCVHLQVERAAPAAAAPVRASACEQSCPGCSIADAADAGEVVWQDSLGREFDFVLDTFPDEPGPRETILPHNPQLTRELELARGDIIIGRPLGMSCGCPITHCGVVMNVDHKTGVVVWCVTGPLNPRAKAHKDIGYYSAEAYEGLVRQTRKELRIGMRYWFMPRRCMLQWRHSGLVNFLSRGKDGMQVRVEGLLIG